MGFPRSRRNVRSEHASRALRGRVVERLEGRVLFAAFSWTGAGADASWSTAGNWAGNVAPTGLTPADTLVFDGGAVRKANTNDLAAGGQFASITFTGTGGFTIGGSSIALGTGGVVDNATGANTLDTPLAITGNTAVSDANAGALTLGGRISGGGAVQRTGGGTVVFTGANTYTGGTTLDGGETFANNASGSAFGAGVVINTSGALRGNGGFSGSLTHNAGLAPGATSGAPGTLATGSVVFGASAGFSLNVAGATAGTGYDQLVVTGVVDLDAGHPLNEGGSTFSPSGGEMLFIIVNDGTDAVLGEFAGLPQDALHEINGYDYQISYEGDLGTNSMTGGNDVVLRAVSVNVAPVNTVPPAQATDEDTPLVFSAANGNAISVADSDAGSAALLVTVSVTSGTLALPSDALVTAGASGSDTFTLTGSAADVTAALDGMSFTPAADSSAAVTLTVVTDDQGNTGAGGALGDADTVTINVGAVNDAPANTVPAAQAVPQDGTVVFGLSGGNRITVADVDAGTDDVAVTLTATDGTVTLGGTAGVTLSGAPDATDEPTLTITGPVASINAALNDVTFRPTAGYAGMAALQVLTSDLGHNGSGGAKTDTDTVAVAVAPAGGIDFDPAAYAVAEDGSGVTLTVRRTNGAAGVATIDYAVTGGGTATAGVDFTNIAGTLTFADGETTRTFSIAVADDALDEDDETIRVSLSNPGGAGVLGVAATTAVVTIVDGDAPPTLSIADASATEGGAATFTVTLSAASGRAVTVDFATADGTAAAGSDFAAAAGTLTFAPGETGKTVAVTTLADVEQEGAETFTVALVNATGATVATGLATGTVNNLTNEVPVAADDVVLLAAGQASLAVPVLANDTDADGDALVVASVSAPSHGTAVLGDDDTVIYTPALGYAGADSFTYAVSDGKGGVATGTVNLTVTGSGVVVNPSNPKKQDLFFAASAGDDQIQLVRERRQVRVLINGQDQGAYAVTGNVVIAGGDGNDTLFIGRLRNPVLFNGGAGDDTLGGGSRNDVLVGGAGNDTLIAGGGRNLIIGGDGADTITASGGSDILIAGPTAYDADTADNRLALNDLLTAWAGRGRYAAKLAAFAAGVGASGARLVPGATVFDDAHTDTLTGGGAADLFVSNLDAGSALDVIVKRARNESVIEL
jgi:autotransporter-associated beta strand protein